MSDSPMEPVSLQAQPRPGPSKRKSSSIENQDMNEPTGPRSSFAIFMILWKDEWEKNPQLNGHTLEGIIMKQCSQLWQTLSFEDKKPFRDLAKMDRDRYKAEMDYFLSVGGVVKKKRKVDPNAPKRPCTQLFRFYRDIRPVVRSELPKLKGDAVKEEISRRWSSLDQVEKAKYNEMYKEDMKRYHQEMKTYKLQQTLSENRAEEPIDLRMINNEGVVDNDYSSLCSLFDEISN